MEEKILIHSIAPYSVVDEKTGNVNEGISVDYFSMSEFENGENNGKIGYASCHASFPLDFLEKFKAGIGFYIAIIKMKSVRVGKNKVPMAKIIDVKFVEKFTIK